MDCFGNVHHESPEQTPPSLSDNGFCTSFRLITSTGYLM
jgi:hypothetical protein